MKKIFSRFIYLFLVICLLFSFKAEAKDKNTLYQVSTINALLEGVYDGNVTFKSLKSYGDFGIGTFDGLDGEMIGFNGDFYQIKSNGKAYSVNPKMKTPFATVMVFNPDKSEKLSNIESYKKLEDYLDNLLPTKNIFFAVKIEGTFNYVKTRSVPKQDKPYPALVEVVKNQPIFEFNNVKGTIVGFRLPDYMGKINVPGYHFHFITDDKTAGGHILECSINDAQVEIDYSDKFFLVLPEQNDFYNANLSEEKQKELIKVEK